MYQRNSSESATELPYSLKFMNSIWIHDMEVAYQAQICDTIQHIQE